MAISDTFKNALVKLYIGRCWLWFCIIQILIALPILVLVFVDVEERRHHTLGLILETTLVLAIGIEIAFKVI